LKQIDYRVNGRSEDIPSRTPSHASVARYADSC
jgi:hypothetical protein